MKLVEHLQSTPRTILGHWPTPFELLPRLTSELGGPRIWVKRDDCTGLATGGNKTRKLEYLIGEAQQQKKEAVVTFGAVQSNHARQTAAACAKVGLPCFLILSDQVTSNDDRYKTGGNVLLDHILGAKTHMVPANDPDAIRGILAELKARFDLYVIPGGGSNATGALGYAQSVVELCSQVKEQDLGRTALIHASSSAGTQAGLLWGIHESEWQADVYGINVYHDDPETLTKTITSLLSDLDERFATNSAESVSIHVNHAYRGDGYGQTNPETIEAIQMLARLEGLLFDPVYSGKAVNALIDQISVGAFAAYEDVIMVHTGGMPALNVYQSSFV